MKKLLLIAFIGTFALTLSSWTTTNSQVQHYSYNFTVPFNETIENPCTGELIDFTGNVHYHGNETITPGGTANIHAHGNLQGVSGIGQESGNTYNWTGSFQNHWTLAVGYEHTWIDTENIISTGSGSNFHIELRHHHTTNGNGTQTVYFDILSFECD